MPESGAEKESDSLPDPHLKEQDKGIMHRDVYRDGEKHRTEEVSPPIPANEAFDYAEEDLREHVEAFVKRFERWHGVTDRNDP